MKYPPSGTKQIAFWSDSTTALGRWSSITLPNNVTDYLLAKACRFFSWADKVAYMRYLAVLAAHHYTPTRRQK